jgi:hypothetical protein
MDQFGNKTFKFLINCSQGTGDIEVCVGSRLMRNLQREENHYKVLLKEQ